MTNNNLNKKDKNYKKGLWAEAACEAFLRVKGYSILARRYKTPVGEVDIVARQGETLVFVEVKARKKLSDALEAVSPKTRQRIANAARHFLSEHGDLSHLMVRFDVMAVTSFGLPTHYCDAWQCEGDWG